VSCIKQTGNYKAKKPLAPSYKIAYDALLTAIKESDKDDLKVHINGWRKIAYSKGISASTEPGSKKKAFQHAVYALQDSRLVETLDDYYWPAKRDRGQGWDMSQDG